MTDLLRIATRQSPLALWQAEFVKAELERVHTNLRVELLPMTTKGDQILNSPLAKIGGKGLFVKELEVAMLEGRADIAVHSMKDVPMDFPDGLALPIICEREDPHDAWVSHRFADLDELPKGGIVGTSSLRRQCQLRALRPDLTVRDLRGNVGTRLSKLDNGDYDAIVLAAAGLKRLKLEERIRSSLPPETCLPAAGQGAVGIECRANDQRVLALLAPLNHEHTAIRVRSERAMNHRLQGGCQVPIAAFAELSESRISGEWELRLRGLVGEPDGSQLLQDEVFGRAADAEKLGVELAERLLSKGADVILKRLYGY